MSTKDTMIKKLGSEEAYKEFLKLNGAKGGKKSRGGGFTGNSEKAKLAGAKGLATRWNK